MVLHEHATQRALRRLPGRRVVPAATTATWSQTVGDRPGRCLRAAPRCGFGGGDHQPHVLLGSSRPLGGSGFEDETLPQRETPHRSGALVCVPAGHNRSRSGTATAGGCSSSGRYHAQGVPEARPEGRGRGHRHGCRLLADLRRSGCPLRDGLRLPFGPPRRRIDGRGGGARVLDLSRRGGSRRSYLLCTLFAGETPSGRTDLPGPASLAPRLVSTGRPQAGESSHRCSPERNRGDRAPPVGASTTVCGADRTSFRVLAARCLVPPPRFFGAGGGGRTGEAACGLRRGAARRDFALHAFGWSRRRRGGTCLAVRPTRHESGGDGDPRAGLPPLQLLVAAPARRYLLPDTPPGSKERPSTQSPVGVSTRPDRLAPAELRTSECPPRPGEAGWWQPDAGDNVKLTLGAWMVSG